MENHDVMFALSKNISESDHPLAEGQIAGTFSFSADQERKQAEVFQILAWRHRKKSKTFFYRWLRQSNWNFVVRQRTFWSRFRALIGWGLGIATRRSLLIGPLLGSKLFFAAGIALLTTRQEPNEELRALIEQGDWDLIAIPSAGFEPATYDAIRVAKSEKIPTLALIDNWDNLVSKTIFWPKPDYLGVWGRQAEHQAIEIHGFSEKQVSQIGTPRFDQYFSARRDFIGERGEYILFVGSAMPFDELGALHEIERSLQSAGVNSMSIVYRPHPWQQKRLVNSTFEEKDFLFTVLDGQIKSAKAQGLQHSSTDIRFQPDLGYYPSLFRGARIVVGPLTTMLLEASLCLRPVIGLSYDDGFHFTTSLSYFSHFDGMESVPGFRFCDKKDLIQQHLEISLSHPPIDPDELDAAISRFLIISKDPYPERLLTLVNRAMEHRDG